MNNNYNSSESIVIDCNKTKIKYIFYGIHENPIKWPQMKPITNPAGYLNVTKELYFHVKDNKLTIPGGYMADHERSKLILNAYIQLNNKILIEKNIKNHNQITKLIPNYPNGAQLYKEIMIEMENGEKLHYSKWKTLKIINWKI